jgi:hypothetical protein
LDGVWLPIIFTCFVYAWSFMTTFFKGYLLLIGLISIVMGLYGMFAPDFSWYPPFETIERGTSLANFVRTISGVFVASGYILIRFIFSSSKVQLGTVLIYLVAFMLVGKFTGFLYDGFLQHDVIAFCMGVITLVSLLAIHRHRKSLLNYDL